MKYRALLGSISYLVLMASSGYAGICNITTAERRHQIDFTVGYSPRSPTWIGTAEDRRFIMVGFGYGYLCWHFSGLSISYVASMMPVAFVSQSKEELTTNPGLTDVAAHSVYGFGILPLGFTVELARSRKLHPFTESAGGTIASTEPIPVNRTGATSLNFIFYLGAGIRWNARPKSAFTLGYRFVHISNAGTTIINPGLDNNVFYIGYTLRR